MHSIYALATLLDPRYKGRLFAPDELEAIKQLARRDSSCHIRPLTHHSRRQRRRRVLVHWTCSTPYWARQRPPHPHQPHHWWMLNCPPICRATLSVEQNRRLNGGQQTLPSTRCWLQKPSAISARRRRPWLVSACLALLDGSTRTNAIGYFPSVQTCCYF